MNAAEPIASDSNPRAGVACAIAAVLADQLYKYYLVERVFRPEGETGTPFFSPVVI